MKEILTRYLRLLCDLAGARAAGLVVDVAGREGRVPVVDVTVDARQAGGADIDARYVPAPVSGGVGCGEGWTAYPAPCGSELVLVGERRSYAVHLRLRLGDRPGGHVERALGGCRLLLALLDAMIDRWGIATARHELPAGSAALDPPLVGRSPAVRRLRERLALVSRSELPLLVEGESGTGKEIVASNAHRLSERRRRPLVILNCMEVPPTLLQSELFGHVKGAFTGAARDRIGLIESAGGGTFFLDEIGELPKALQAVLLRVLQEKEVRRIGESTRRRVDVRFVFATNRRLERLVAEGGFREDLYYRINGVRLSIPPLRDRPEDVLPLAEHFLSMHCTEARVAGAGGGVSSHGNHGRARAGSPCPGDSWGGPSFDATDGGLPGGCRERKVSNPAFTPDAARLLCTYRWPGNVRELKNEMERIAVFFPGARLVEADMLSPRIRDGVQARSDGEEAARTLPEAVRRLERRMITEALGRTGGNRTRAAVSLGITRQGLLKKLKRHGLGGGDEEPSEAT